MCHLVNNSNAEGEKSAYNLQGSYLFYIVLKPLCIHNIKDDPLRVLARLKLTRITYYIDLRAILFTRSIISAVNLRSWRIRPCINLGQCEVLFTGFLVVHITKSSKRKLHLTCKCGETLVNKLKAVKKRRRFFQS